MNDHDLRYFENYALGATSECGSVSIDAASIISFAKGFDPQHFRVDPVAAADGPFGGLIASGWHTAALTVRLLVDNFLSAEASLGGGGADEIRCPYPVRPGDTLRVQDGRTVMRCTAINFLRVRTAVGPRVRNGPSLRRPGREIVERGEKYLIQPRKGTSHALRLRIRACRRTGRRPVLRRPCAG